MYSGQASTSSEQPSKSSVHASKSFDHASYSSEHASKKSEQSLSISITSSDIEELCKTDLKVMRKWRSINSKVVSAVDALLQGEKQKFEQKLLHKIFEENCINVANLPAVVSEDNLTPLTFKELSEESNRVARTISMFFKSKMHKFNGHMDWIIALYMKPTYRAVICMLAAWKVGAGYLPLNYEDPKRIKEILNQAKPQLVIIDDAFITTESHKFLEEFDVVSFKRLAYRAKQHRKESFPDEMSMMHGKINEDNLAMVLYSSEIVSPRGTRLLHHSCQHRLEWQWTKFPFQSVETHCIAHNAIYHIDNFAEIWGTLLKGKTVVMMRSHSRKDIERIIRTIEEFNIMRFYGLPSKIDKILDSVIKKTSSNPKAKKLLMNVVSWISSGDVLEKDVAVKFFNYYENDGKHTLTNSYGCTETTGDCCYYVMTSLEQIQELERIPIGFPCYGTFIYILDEDDDPVVKNQTGGIHIVGPLLAAAYIDDADDTVYKHNRYSLYPANWNMFYTEDYGTIINKLLYYDGKKKIRVRYDDHNVDYLTIEKFINELEYVENAIVIPTKEKLVVFIILHRTQARITKPKVVNDIRRELPEYAVPDVVIYFRFPLLQDGEVDKDALIQEYNLANDPNIKKHENLIIELDGISEDKKEMAKRVFTIIGNNIGRDLTGSIKPSTNFFNIGGCSLNVVSSIYELYRKGYSITADSFLKAKDFNEILNQIKPVGRHSCIREDYGFGTNDNWKISIVRYDDLPECLDCLLECYTTKHVLMKHIPQITADSLRRFIEYNWTCFVERRLSFKVVDKELDKTIGVALNIELEEESYMSFNEFAELEPILEFQRFMEESYVKEDYRHNAYLTNYFMGTSMDMTPAENVNLIYCMEDHLIKLMNDSNFNGIYSNGVCPLNAQIGELILDYRIIEKYPVNRYVDNNNNRPFENAPNDIVQYVQVYAPKKR